MGHLIERVLELSDEEVVPQLTPQPAGQGTDEELRALLESLQPRIRVYGVGGAGCNAVGRLESEGLFENSFVTGYAINTDAQALLMSPLENKILIGRTARGRGAGGDPTKGEAAALESEMSLRTITTDTQLAIIAAGMGGGSGPLAYSAAKAGVINFCKNAAIELGPNKIRVNAISPGTINTPLLATAIEDSKLDQPIEDFGIYHT